MSVHGDLRLSRGISDALVGGASNIEARQTSTDQQTLLTPCRITLIPGTPHEMRF